MKNDIDEKSLLNAFDIERKKPNEENINDYDVFPDKVLLDKLRSKIIENIIDIKNITILSILVKINIKGMHPITEARNILESFV